MMVHLRVVIIFYLVLNLYGINNSIIAQTRQEKKLIILIDPGHGGRDSGAVGVNGVQEKHIVLIIAKTIVDLNRTYLDNRYEIYLTRYQDTLISLEDRAKLAKGLKADIFLSLHCNHADNPNARGVEVYISKKQGKYSRESILLAYDLQRGLKQHLGMASRGVKLANFQVLRETINEGSSLLLEMGFMSNQDENQFISRAENSVSYAYAILKSLTKQGRK